MSSLTAQVSGSEFYWPMYIFTGMQKKASKFISTASLQVIKGKTLRQGYFLIELFKLFDKSLQPYYFYRYKLTIA